MDLIGGIKKDDGGKEGLRLQEIQATVSVIIVDLGAVCGRKQLLIFPETG